ncbi:MAG: glutamyl-tRNA reductase [Nitriliruptorales bacterium]
MSLLVVGLNHRTADLALLEKVAIPSEEQAKALHSVLELEHVLGAAVLSTCNRVEVYAHVTRFHAGLHEIVTWLGDRAGADAATIVDAHYAYYEHEAAAHLFAVAAGVDSVVVGERQVALQVKDAARVATEEATIGSLLQRLFERALGAARRVRQETTLDEGASSMVDIGIDTAAQEWEGGLEGLTVAILGAGALGGLAADRLAREPVARVLVQNRTRDKAVRLAARVNGDVADDELRPTLTAADLVVCCTGAPVPVVGTATVDAAIRERPDRPLVLVDLGLPRNVDPGCADLAGVTLVDLETIRRVHDSSPNAEVLEAAQEVVDEEAARFSAWMRAVQVEPTVVSLRERAEGVRQAELERLGSRLSSLDPREREVVEALTRGIISTLLHDPTVRLKELADRGGAESYAMALRELFDLDE